MLNLTIRTLDQAVKPLLLCLILPASLFAASPAGFDLAPTPDDAEQFACAWNEDQLSVLEKLNRCDRETLRRQERIVVPRTWLDDELSYAPVPGNLDWAADLRQLVVVHKPLQIFAAYEQGRLVRWGPVSTGAEGSPTPSGLFYLNWRSKGHRSTVNRSWYLPWYFNFSNRTGHSFHQYELPGRPASHGCVRLLERDARWMYDWGRSWKLDDSGRNILENGAPVVILGEYPHDETPPWLEPSLLDSGFAVARSGVWLSRAALDLAGAQWSAIAPDSPTEPVALPAE